MVQPREQDIPQPFPGEPGLARLRVRKNILMGHTAIRQNPFAGTNVPAGVAIAQHALGAFHACEQEHNGHEERYIRQRREYADDWVRFEFHHITANVSSGERAGCAVAN